MEKKDKEEDAWMQRVVHLKAKERRKEKLDEMMKRDNVRRRVRMNKQSIIMRKLKR